MSARWIGAVLGVVAAASAGVHGCMRREVWPGPTGPGPGPGTGTGTGTGPGTGTGTVTGTGAGTHPRILLTPDRLAAVRGLRSAGAASWRALQQHCDEDARETVGSGYQAWDWANAALDLALCHDVTGRPDYARAGVRYLRALLDDGEKVGDGAGGDAVVRHDDGYGIRTRGCFGALAYDWLHDVPGMTAELRRHAVDRFVAWVRWFSEQGYNRDEPIANYYAGYFGAVAFGGIAAQGDDPRAGELLRRAQHMMSAEIVPTYRRELDGGDFPEGWQYGDMVGAVLAIVADAEARGHDLRGAQSPFDALPWLRQTVAYRTHALLPDGRHTFDTGDWSDKPALAPPHAVLALSVVLPATDPVEREAHALARLAADPNEEWHWLAALGDDPSRAVEDPRRGATSYFARGTGTVFARTDWSPRAVWVAMTSAPALADHQHLDAGHFEIARGNEALVVDSGGYASFSSLSHNVLAVDDGKENDPYAPSQGTWGKTTRVARHEDAPGWSYTLADYASAYDPEGWPADHPQRSVTRAERELLFSRAPVAGAPESARVVVYDRVTLSKPSYGVTFLLHGGSAPQAHADGARFVVGASAAAATTLLPAGAEPALVREPTDLGDGAFYANDPPEGVSSVRLEVRSPKGDVERRFLHAIVVGPAGMRAPEPARIEGDDVDGVAIEDEAYVFPRSAPQLRPAALRYRAPAASVRHLVASLAPGAGYAVRVEPEDGGCSVSIEPGGDRAASSAGVLAFALGAGCALRR